VEEFNRDSAPERFATIAQALGVDTTGLSVEDASRSAIKAICDLTTAVGIPSGFGDLGVVIEDIEQWVQPALNDPCTPGNPKTLSADDVRRLYRLAL
jgi:alcohol dehydrogenase class IV